jgi:tRNA (guanine-N(7)-)-methyltransferase subunit TRM82
MFFPYTHLFVRSQHTIASLGPHIVVLDTLYVSRYSYVLLSYSPTNRTGTVLSSTYKNRIDDESVTRSGPVRCLDVNCEGKRLASVGDDKILKIWELVRQDSDLHLRLMNRR